MEGPQLKIIQLNQGGEERFFPASETKPICEWRNERTGIYQALHVIFIQDIYFILLLFINLNKNLKSSSW